MYIPKLILLILALLLLFPSPNNLHARGMICPLLEKAPIDSTLSRVINQLIQDGYVDEKEDDIYFFVLKDRIETNGNILTGNTFEKYISLLESMKIEPEEYWGFYSTEDGGDFQGVGNAIIMGQLVEAYKKDQKNNQREKTENAPVGGIKRLKLMHNIIEDLSAKIRNEGIIREDADRILIAHNDGKLFINEQLLTDNQSIDFLQFLKNKGIVNLKNGFKLTIYPGKEHWTVEGEYETTF